LDRCATGDGIEMSVEDDGCGFDVEAAREAGGLGLLSIDERVRLVRGTSTIERRPEGGTTLRLTVPLRGVTDDDTADRAACG
jgi:signal transduction histidine kinase